MANNFLVLDNKNGVTQSNSIPRSHEAITTLRQLLRNIKDKKKSKNSKGAKQSTEP